MISRPNPDEYAPFAAGYISLVGNDPVIDILDYQKDSIYNFFVRLDPGKADYAYAEGKWTIKQVLGHMVDTERVFQYRALAFSREAIELPGFDQDVYMQLATFKERSLEDIANEFKAVRDSTLYLFRSMTDEQFARKGIASGHPVSVKALTYMVAGHAMHHINILKERYL